MASLWNLVWIYVFLQPLASKNSIIPERSADLLQRAIEVILRHARWQDIRDALDDWLVVGVVVSGLVDWVCVSGFRLCNHFVRN